MDIYFNDYDALYNDVLYKEETKNITWNVYKILNFPPILQGSIWEIYAENDIKIKPKECHRIALGLGYEMSKGVICASIVSNLKLNLALLNGLFLDQKTENIIICLFNFSQEQTIIKKGNLFGYIKYLN